jgi:hypothetical protein
VRTTTGADGSDLELLAALVDGRASGRQRARALKRLDESEALREVLAEVLRLREEEARAGGGSVAPWRAPAARRWLVPAAAAAAALATAAIVWWRPGPGAPALDVAWLGRELATPALGERLAGDWYEQGWSVTRGPAPEAEATGAVIPFRLGVRAVDLEAALRAGRSADADLLAQRLEALLGTVELSEAQRRAYAEARAALDTPEGAASALELVRLADRLNADHPGLDPAAYELGKWAEAGRLGALAGNERLLRSREFRGALDRGLERARGGPAGPPLERLRIELGAGPASPDFDALANAFAGLIALH